MHVGEAEYINDMNHQPGELYAAFVISTVGNASIKFIDPAEALVRLLLLLLDNYYGTLQLNIFLKTLRCSLVSLLSYKLKISLV